MQHVDLSVVLAIIFFSQVKRWNRPDVLHCSWPLYFHCITVAALKSKIVLVRGNVLVMFFPLSGLLSIGVPVISFFLSG